jgi:CHASE1-domain containing sensor protein
METRKSKQALLSLAQNLGVASTAAVASLALTSWALGWGPIGRFGAITIPMAPATAIAFLAMSGAAFALMRWPAKQSCRVLSRTVAAVVGLWSLLIAVQAMANIQWDLERWFSSGRPPALGSPVGSMSPITGVLFLILALSLLVWSPPASGRRAGGDLVGGLALGVAAVGALTATGYGLGRPLLYGGWVIPVSLPTALAFVTLGGGVWAGVQAGLQFRHHRLLLALVPGTGILFAFAMFALVDRLERRQVQSGFDQRVSLWATALRHSIDADLEELFGLRSLFELRAEVRRDEFRTFAADSIQLHPSIQALEWLPWIPAAQRKAYESTARREGLKDFQIVELGPEKKLVPAGPRAEYFPIYFVEPLIGNESALGFDPWSEATRRAGLERSRDTGERIASGRITLVQESGQQAGVVVTLPVYRNDAPHSSLAERRTNLRGFISGVFRLGNLVATPAQSLEQEGISFTLKDVTDLPMGELLARNAMARESWTTGLRWGQTIALAGRSWQMEFNAGRTYLSRQHTWLAWIVLLVGLLLAGGLQAQLLTAARHSAERERLIAELQSALSEVKTLKGFIPICASCKKIRDDQGYWNQIESYIQAHSNATFSHGLCPECTKKYFPEFGGK